MDGQMVSNHGKYPFYSGYFYWMVITGIIVVSLISGASAGENDLYIVADPGEPVYPQFIACGEMFHCMEVSDAIQSWGSDGYVKFSESPCANSDIPRIVGGFYKYCFKKKLITDVPVVNTTTPVPGVSMTPPVLTPVRLPAGGIPARYVVQEEGGQQVGEVPAIVSPVMIRKGASSQEALIALRMAVGKLPYAASYDLNNDGFVNSADAREILRLSVQGWQGG
jgi:hypothetical protein